VHSEIEDVGYRPPSKPWELKLRSTQDFKAQLEALARLWRLYGQAAGDDYEKIDISYVVRSLLEQGIDAGFAEFNGLPKNEAGWAELAEAIRLKSGKKSSKH
jgi:hypothetical protein